MTYTINILNECKIDRIGYTKMTHKHKISKLLIICGDNGTLIKL